MTEPNTGKCFSTYFPLHYQTSENTFPEFTFLEFTFLGIHFPKGNYFPANKWGLSSFDFSQFSYLTLFFYYFILNSYADIVFLYIEIDFTDVS
jgi:hypothetical protein